MEITEIREKLHRLIDIIEDKKAEAMYALFEDEIAPDEPEDEYTDEFKTELDERYEHYKNGGKMISAEEANDRIKAIMQADK